MNKYMAYFDFTTVHKNGKFIGRNGQFAFESRNDMEQAMTDVGIIENLCAQYVLSQKPKWEILTITVTNIKQLNQSRRCFKIKTSLK